MNRPVRSMIGAAAPQSKSPIRVLLIAELANPAWASVPLVGYSMSKALLDITQGHLVTHVRNADDIRSAGLVEGEDFTALSNDHVAGPLWNLSTMIRGSSSLNWTTASVFTALSYYSFENAVWAQFREKLERGDFDIVHRITPLSPTHQSPIARRLAKLKIPFVIGPLNGGVPWPKGFNDRRRAEIEYLSYVRSAYKLLPHYTGTRKHAAAIIAGSHHTASEMPSWADKKTIYIPENAIDPSLFQIESSRSFDFPLKVAFVGRLVPYKGADILLEACKSFLQEGRVRLEIVGDGPERSKLEAMAREFNVSDKVTFHGWLPQTGVKEVLKQSHVFAFPSIREFGGGVVIEAMAMAMAPVVANYAGPGELVDSSVGFPVDFSDKESLTLGFKQTIGKILENPSILEAMGNKARERVFQQLTWKAKAEQILKIYEAVLAGRTDFDHLGLG